MIMNKLLAQQYIFQYFYELFFTGRQNELSSKEV